MTDAREGGVAAEDARPASRHRTVMAVLLALAFCGWARPASAQGTVYVPNPDPAYGDLDLLITTGLVREVMVGERPYSRAAFRGFVEEARARIRVTGGTARSREALERLTRRFATERDGAPSTGRPSLTSAGADVTLARSPTRAMRPGSGDRLHAFLNPLLQGNQGRQLADGATAALEAGIALEHGRFAVQLSPRAWVSRATGQGSEASGTVTAAYGRAVFGPLALDVGRNNVAFGYGPDGGPLLSNNARGLDMIRLATRRPVHIPSLGAWQVSVALADMGKNRDIPGSVLGLVRISGRPSANVEFGLNYLNLQGGQGAPPATFPERLHDFFFLLPGGNQQFISDKVAGVDLRVSVPRLSSALYVNFLTTDDREAFTQPAGGYWEDAAWSVGAEVRDLGPQGRADVALEWRHAGPRAHTHGQFTSGITLDGRTLGDGLGPNAAGVRARFDWNGSSSRTRVEAAWERYSGDDFTWYKTADRNYDWYRLADNPDEIRQRLTVEHLRYSGWRGLETRLRIGYEHVTRFDFTNDTRTNVVGQMTLRFVR